MEQWVIVPEFPNYEVSDQGNIRRAKHTPGTRFKVGRYLKPQEKRGYYQVALCNNGKVFWRALHRIILSSFVPQPDGPIQCNHINGNKLDNRLSNLEWVTPSENRKHSIEQLNVKLVSGENHGMAILSNQDVRAIRALLKTGKFTQSEIAKMFDISQTAISNIKTGRRRNHS